MIPMQFSRVLLALPILLGIMLCAQVAGGELAPFTALRESYASTGLLVAVGFIALELPRLFEFLAAKAETGAVGKRAHLALANLALHGSVPFYPRLRVLNSASLSAISIGVPGNGVIFITRGLVERLDDEALEVTLVHELQHLASRHSLFHYAFVLSVVLLKMVLGLSAWLAPVLLLGYLATLRRFEYAADAGAARILGAERVARGLRSIRKAVEEADFGLVQEIFSTHPPTCKRIVRVLAR